MWKKNTNNHLGYALILIVFELFIFVIFFILPISHKFTDISKKKNVFQKTLFFTTKNLCFFEKKFWFLTKKIIFCQKVCFFCKKKIFVFVFVLKKSIDSFNIGHKGYKNNYFHNFRPLSGDSYGVEKKNIII